jgi:hypothetical protein
MVDLSGVRSATDPDAPTEADAAGSAVDHGRSRRAVRLLVMAVALPVALFVVLRPNRFGIVPNALDPIFYTGYALNLEGILTAAGDDHYFITRWTTYLPSHYAAELLGPHAGRLAVRLVLATGMLLALWSLRPRWTDPQRLFIGAVVLTMPIFTRAFLTDYVEFAVVSLGFVLVAVALAGRRGFGWGLLLGGLTAGMAIANPFAVVVAGPPLLVAVARTVDRGRLRVVVRAPLVLATGIAVGAVAVVLAGLVWFRLRYDVPNVYAPTIDWVRENADHVDNLKADAPGWWWYYTWIWGVPTLLLSAAVLHRLRRVRFDRTEALALLLLAAQYAIHWLDHLGRQGNMIEIPYYWSFVYPALGVATALFLGRVTADMGWRTAALGALAWFALLVLLPSGTRLPVGPGLLLVLGTAVVGTALASRRWLPAAGIGVVLVVLVTQVAAPQYAPDRFGANMNPLYHEIYWAGDGPSVSEDLYRELIWFEERLDPVPRNGEALFVTVGPWSSLLPALYGAHVGGQFLTYDNGGLTDEQLADTVRSGSFPVVVVVGSPDEVDRIAAFLPDDGNRAELLDVATSPEPLGMRLAVFDVVGAAWLPYEWQASDLPTATGRLRGDALVADDSDPAGYVSYGPYVALSPGTYTVTVTYRSRATTDQRIGVFDAVATGGPPVASTELAGTGGDLREVELTFRVEDPLPLWEFRVLREQADIEVLGVALRSPDGG